MPGFDFAKGNARKLLSLPLYALGALASLVVPRSRDRWVFGCGTGIGEGSLELYRYLRATHPELRLTWLARDDADVAAASDLGIEATPKSRRQGLWLTLRARVAVVTHGFGDVNRYGTRGAFVVQLWHGIPLKLIQLDSPATMTIGIPGAARLRGLLRRFYRRGYRGIGLMPAASVLVADRLRTAFGLGDQLVVTGDPRDDVLSRGTAQERRSTARRAVFAALGLADAGERVILFAPTWRDGEPDPDAPDPEQWRAIAAQLESSRSLLVVRPHPLGVGDYSAGPAASGRILMLGSDRATTVTALLPAFDALITDYSSIAYDYSLTGGPIFFLAPDEESYTLSRGLYEPYREFSGGNEVRSWAGLLAQLARFDSDRQWAAEVLRHSEMLRDSHFAYRDGHNTARVYCEISNRLDAR